MNWQLASEIGRVVAASHVLLVTILFTCRLRALDRIMVFFMGLGAAVFLIFPMLLALELPRLVLALCAQSGQRKLSA
ncbi:MAG: hypothetical protein KDK39_10320 [Leptospiraceae bacterium]|nr:hypothetical protein [Leptospiraceae bacterium]